ncbi:uncharacterized protein LOC133179772 [Saccostrea echinata]|uniref:uncharacterized protein LOC133179772 n=1 Tax=Saccostrea echinata TaxID=191078 RepID=UPI002A8017F0|nr:uncharacterized protein LOC133179772 [Saccostrea echinata]
MKGTPVPTDTSPIRKDAVKTVPRRLAVYSSTALISSSRNGCAKRAKTSRESDAKNADPDVPSAGKKTQKKSVSPPCPETCGLREEIFSGPDTANTFCLWLFNENNAGAIVIAHNMRGYDGVFILRYLIENGLPPQHIIYSGSKIMSMTVGRGLNMRFLDSLNFFQMPLSRLPKTFGLTELKKGYFPHFFNRPENQTYVGPYPPPEEYGIDHMTASGRSDFLRWHAEQRDRVFDFATEMKDYCRSDVTILRDACLKFRALIAQATDDLVDPFASSTVASMCMTIFRTCHLREEVRVRLGRATGLQLPARDGQVHYQNRWYSREEFESATDMVLTNPKCEIVRPLKDEGWYTGHYRAGTLTLRLPDGSTTPYSDLELEGMEKIEERFHKSPIAVIPPNGYHRRDHYSVSGIRWLEWLAHSRQLDIRHALRGGGGEARLPGTRIKFDGLAGNRVFEFLGCRWHGCPTCFPKDRSTTKLPGTGQTLIELFELTKRREEKIREAGYQYESVWEHEFHRQLRDDPDMRRFVYALDIQPPLDPRDSFFGGRTNAIRLHYKVQPGEEIRYVDFTSLYPWTSKTCRYPVGHPQIVRQDFQALDQYFGLAKVKVYPPRELFFPVLPVKNNAKLKFALCMPCADQELKTPCTHDDEKRAIIGTWTTPELDLAVRKGYRIGRIYEVYHWTKTEQYDEQTQEGGLFTSYINAFLKLKQEASGFPAWCQTQDDCRRYLEQYFENEGIKLDWAYVEKNPGLRAVAKMCLNSFWGKLGQRSNLPSTRFFYRTDLEEFYHLLTDKTKEVIDFNIETENVAQVHFRAVDSEWAEEDSKTNVFLATFTTAWARLKLYDVLDSLQKDVLYHDTDSVIYVCRPTENEVPLGDYLGELTNELEEGDYIEEFVSGGPKNYAYRTHRGVEKVCVKGFTLNYTNSQIINFDSIKDLLQDERAEPPRKKRKLDTPKKSKIIRDKASCRVLNRDESKQYQIVYTKRVLKADMTTVPYGY